MLTQCNPDALLFAPVEGRSVVASFTGGAITSDAGALLLGATDRAIGLVERFTACFQDARDPDLIEHELPPSSASACSGSRSAMRTSSTTTNCGTIRHSPCSPESSRHDGARTARRWPASRP